MQSWRDPIDLYCERLDLGLWAEPLNAITNGAFVLAGLWLIGWFAKTPGARPQQVLGGLIVCIGIGSGLFHTVAERWAVWADVGSILITLMVFICIWLKQVMGLSWRWAWLGAPGFLAWSYAVAQVIPPEVANGSGSYAAAWLGLAIIAAIQAVRGAPGAGGFLATNAIFSVSLIFRSVDQAWCPQWPWGTHFAWHVLNAMTLTVATLALARAAQLGSNELPGR